MKRSPWRAGPATREALVSTLLSRLAINAQGADAMAALRDADEIVAMRGGVAIEPSLVLSENTLTLIRLGRRGDAEASVASHKAEAERSGLRMAMATRWCSSRRSPPRAATSRRESRLAANARTTGGDRMTVVQLGFYAQILASRMEQGRLAEVTDQLRQFDDYGVSLPPWRAMLAGALADMGRTDEAAAELDRLRPEFEDGFQHLYGGPLAVRHVSTVCRQLQDVRLADELLTHVLPYGGMMLALYTSIEGAADRSVGHLLATLGRYDEADGSYTSAAELERSAGFPPLLARTEYWHARALLERDAPGDRERAAGLLDEAIEIASRLRMQLLCSQASELRPA